MQPPAWHACTGGQCATLTVPLDYSDPDGKTVKLAVFRIPAKDPKQRIGALLFNPGRRIALRCFESATDPA